MDSSQYEKRVLVTGVSGQLGQTLQALASLYPTWRWTFAERYDLDLSQPDSIEAYFANHRFDFCINAAAYTAVDKAEAEADVAFQINHLGLECLAVAAQRQGCRLLHISTDYLYHNPHQNIPFTEDAELFAQGVYARSKAAGEQALQALPHASLIIRTSWLYSPYGHNFLRTMLRLGAERELVRVVYDQVGTPTFAEDLAHVILLLVERAEQHGLFDREQSTILNFSNEGVASWYDFAASIFRLRHLPAKLLPIRTAEYPTPAARPAFSVMDKALIKNVLSIEIAHWEEALGRCLRRLDESKSKTSA